MKTCGLLFLVFCRVDLVEQEMSLKKNSTFAFPFLFISLKKGDK
jgi:hypothetical protein